VAAWAAAGDGSAVRPVGERQWRCDGGSSEAGRDAAACGRAEAGGRCCVGAAKTTPGGDAAAAGYGEQLRPAAADVVGPEKGRAVGVAAAVVEPEDQMPECARCCCWPQGHGSGGDSAAAVAADVDDHRPDPPSAPGSDRSWLAAVVAAVATDADDGGCGPWRRRWEAADG
jgi:hypothetical protein